VAKRRAPPPPLLPPPLPPLAVAAAHHCACTCSHITKQQPQARVASITDVIYQYKFSFLPATSPPSASALRPFYQESIQCPNAFSILELELLSMYTASIRVHITL
jgi:hypothetical protein